MARFLGTFDGEYIALSAFSGFSFSEAVVFLNFLVDFGKDGFECEIADKGHL